MKVLVVGSGGREHALVWAIHRSQAVERLVCAPGNPGIARLAELAPVPASDGDAIVRLALRDRFDLVVIGPEQPLADGLSDRLSEHGVAAFGPSRRAAELEWSKAFAKSFMDRHAIPTARHATFGPGQEDDARKFIASHPLPVVLKADGLAAGKGVLICATHEEALRQLGTMKTSFGSAGSRIVVEEFLEGEEASVFAISDGEHYITLAPAQDHKRVFDGDRGKNTGGMGAYAPAPVVTPEALEDVRRRIIGPTLRGMAAEDRPFRGCLYVGLMITASGPKVVEYNCRFGDPETQVVIPLYNGDLAALLHAAAAGTITPEMEQSASGSAVCVVLASGGYPDAYASGKRIDGIAQAEAEGALVFQAGTQQGPEGIVTAGGRVLGVTAVVREGGIRDGIAAAYRAVAKISFEGMQFRRDIGRRALERPPVRPVG